MHYVIGDVHGCYDELMALLDKIEQQDSEAKIIFIGDLIDRGPKVWDVLTWAMEHITSDGKYQTVRGNHEQMVIEWYEEFEAWCDEKIHYGTRRPMPKTHYDFSRRLAAAGNLTPGKARPFIRFFQSMPFSRQVKVQSVYGRPVTYRIVHAWYDADKPEHSSEQHLCNIWERNYWGRIGHSEIIIHGHTPTIVQDYMMRGIADAPGMICYRPGAVNIDGGCCFSDHYRQYPCMLCAICLETLDEIYPYTLAERFAQKARSGAVFPIDGLLEPADGQEDLLYTIFEKTSTETYQRDFLKKTPPPRLNMLKQLGQN